MGLYDTIIIAYIIIITHVGILIRRFQKVEQSVLYIVFFFYSVRNACKSFLLGNYSR